MSRAAGRSRAVEQVTEVFRRNGYQGASLSDVAAATGLGRSSLYHYFPGGKGDMARAALDLISRWIEDLEARVQASCGLHERLDRFASGLDALYDGGRTPCLLGALSVGTDAGLAHELGRTMARSIDVLAKILQDDGGDTHRARALAEDAIAQIQGALVLTRALRDPAPFIRSLDALRALRPR